MGPACEHYARAIMGEHEWMLGRFVCPLSRLDEFSRAAAPLMPGTYATSGYREAMVGEPWRISAIVELPADAEKVEADVARTIDRINRFNIKHAEATQGLAAIDMCEIKVATPDHIDSVLDQLPPEIFPFFEMPVTTDCRGWVTALSGAGAGAKIRTGGIVGNAFPTPDEVSAFLHACALADVPFKATAGLHHPVRGSFRLTYEPDSASCTMFGFLNIFVAATLVRAKRIDETATKAILTEQDPAAFRVSEQVLGWRELMLDASEIARARETFALSFGSCSFDEPLEDLRRLGMLQGS
jgi:hypothetical protein